MAPPNVKMPILKDLVDRQCRFLLGSNCLNHCVNPNRTDPICASYPLSLTSILASIRYPDRAEAGRTDAALRSLPPGAFRALLLVVAVIALGLVRPVPAAQPEILVGAAAVIDGDTFRIGETVVRLFDVDAPELAQTCDGAPTRLRPCGAYALAEHLAGQEVRCEVIKLDQYDRRVARCNVEGEGLSEWLVTSGLAMVFRRLLGSLHRGGRRCPDGRDWALADGF